MVVPSEAVLNRVAEAEGVEPSELDTPLYAVIDPDALDMLFWSDNDGPTRDTGEVRFEYSGYKVTVSATGDVSVAESV